MRNLGWNNIYVLIQNLEKKEEALIKKFYSDQSSDPNNQEFNNNHNSDVSDINIGENKKDWLYFLLRVGSHCNFMFYITAKYLKWNVHINQVKEKEETSTAFEPEGQVLEGGLYSGAVEKRDVSV